MNLFVAGFTEEEIAVFSERRRKAVEFWANVPVEVFNMRKWTCGSKGCALGWLGVANHDGWQLGQSTYAGQVPIAPTGSKGYHGAAEYFGISDAQARACFGGEKETAKFHHRWFIDRVTPSDVGKALLALPYVRRY